MICPLAFRIPDSKVSYLSLLNCFSSDLLVSPDLLVWSIYGGVVIAGEVSSDELWPRIFMIANDCSEDPHSYVVAECASFN